MTSPQYLKPDGVHRAVQIDIKLLVFQLFVSFLCSFYLESAFELAGYERTNVAAGIFFRTLTLGSVARGLCFFAGTFVVLRLVTQSSRLASWVLSHRFHIALTLLVLLVAFEISGSSLALWGSFLGDEPFNGTLFGTPRIVRSDEWEVFTPFSFSQVTTGNHAISHAIRGTSTDVTMVYAQPSLCLATAFRPFLWGYLVLGASRGLAFYWCSRAILLVLVSYECMLLLANGKRGYAAYGALLVGFAPIIEWWFAVNGTAELFIFGQGLVLSLHHLLRAHSTPAKWAWSALLAWLLGCYALIFYPSWQVPLVYVFGSLGVWVLACWVQERKGMVLASLRGLIPPLIICVVLFCGLAGVSVLQAWDVIQAEASTVYPGSRSSVGGGYIHILSHVATPMLSTLWPELFTPNPCETAAFISLFPLGIVLSIVTLVRQKMRSKRLDVCTVAMLCAYALLFAYGMVGFPPFLAKITLLSHAQTGRLPLAIGYLDIALLVRAIALRDVRNEHQQVEPSRGLTASLLSLVCIFSLAACYLAMASSLFPDLMSSLTAKATLVLATTLLSLPVVLPSSVLNNRGSSRQAWLVSSAALVVAVGMCVNPIQHGANTLLQSPTLQSVKEIVQKDPDATWVTDSSVMGQACITVGAPTITCVNVYPNLELWHKLDPNGTNKDKYNRYAHVQITLGDQLSFENPQADVLNVTVTPDDLLKLGVTYWISGEDLSQWNDEHVIFDRQQAAGPFTIYKIVPA